MEQAQALRVKQVSRISRERASPFHDHSPRSIKRVPDQRMSCPRKMNPYLMRSSRFDADADQGAARSSLQDLDQAERRSAGGVGGMHASKERMRHGTDGRPDRERTPARHSAGQGAIGSCHFVASQGRCENRPGTCRARQQHDSRCPTPQAMHGSGFGTDPPDQGEKRVIEKAARGDRGKTSRLRDRQEVLIGVEDGIRERHVRLFPGRTPPGQPLARFQNDAPSRPPAIQAYFTVLQPSHPFRLRRMTVCGGQVLPDRKTGPSRVDLLPVFVPLVQSQALSLSPKCRPFEFPRSRLLGRSPRGAASRWAIAPPANAHRGTNDQYGRQPDPSQLVRDNPKTIGGEEPS